MGTETEDSFRATGHHGESIGFLAADGFVAGCPIGAFLRGTDAGCQGIVGNEHLLTDQGKGHGVGGSSDVGNGVIGVSSSSTSSPAVKSHSGVLGIHTTGGNGVTGKSVDGDGVSGVGGRRDGKSYVGGNGVHGKSVSPRAFGVVGENDGATTQKEPSSNDGVRGITSTLGYDGPGGDSSNPDDLPGFSGNLIPWSLFGGPGAGVVGVNRESGNGVVGWSLGGDGILGVNGMIGNDHSGVHGVSGSSGGSGVYGENNNGGYGVIGSTKSKDWPSSTQLPTAGVLGSNGWSGPGIAGSSNEGDGVLGKGGTNGVHGKSSSSTNSGVWGKNNNGGYGVSGSTKSIAAAGVWGSNQSRGPGVIGSSSSGDGVVGKGGTESSGVLGENSDDGAGVTGRSLSGYGGDFQGGLAPLHLNPGPANQTGRPTDNNNHNLGELYLDSVGSLFLCVSPGTPGSWVQIQVQPVP